MAKGVRWKSTVAVYSLVLRQRGLLAAIGPQGSKITKGPR